MKLTIDLSEMLKHRRSLTDTLAVLRNFPEHEEVWKKVCVGIYPRYYWGLTYELASTLAMDKVSEAVCRDEMTSSDRRKTKAWITWNNAIDAHSEALGDSMSEGYEEGSYEAAGKRRDEAERDYLTAEQEYLTFRSSYEFEVTTAELEEETRQWGILYDALQFISRAEEKRSIRIV